MKTPIRFAELSAAQVRQYIDAEAVFSALEEASRDASSVRGSMFWREQHGRSYLIRTSTAGAQTSLGPRGEETVGIYERFTEKKRVDEERVRQLKTALAEQQRLNRALRVGRAPPIVIDTLNAIAKADLHSNFTVIGTHALYAYEAAAGVMLEAGATATQDVDLLFDTRKRLNFWSRLQRLDTSFLAVLRQADKTFRVRTGQRYTVVNDKGFEIDVVRRLAVEDDPHPLRLSGDEEDLWPVQIATGQTLLNAMRFSQMVVSASGSMARMPTIDPRTFVRVKRWLAAQAARDPLKRRKDALQADTVDAMLAQYLPHLEAHS
ncbi:nucleotidyltransferase domain-containing protein [Variovorax sp. N23]|uniref:nucleotidyltransferase domain-containing protein n=1 Tax=Variovorax sp. N23 TaxID=2980555 RepID=UPI0021C776D5|nr:nucleotidyltransferase domain-containing protein [Variovorax sp. N23]MCU4121253.1 nucleotidyltransferase domain-containing protein [Variovorax sp. N23]